MKKTEVRPAVFDASDIKNFPEMSVKRILFQHIVFFPMEVFGQVECPAILDQPHGVMQWGARDDDIADSKSGELAI